MREYANRRKAVLKSPAGGNAGGIFIWSNDEEIKDACSWDEEGC